MEKEIIELIKDEVNDDYSDDSLFNISSWGADLTFRELISMYEENELVKPELQRKYVWDKNEASRFIESLLLGLPVPSIFLAQAGSQKLIVDGYQRIMTVYDYVRGIFTTDSKVFKLSNSEKINKRWRNKAFSELSIDDQRKIKSSTIHAIIFEQKKPENDTSLYQIFERINTSGRSLNSQEIRNCVYQGSFNRMLISLNEDKLVQIHLIIASNFFFFRMQIFINFLFGKFLPPAPKIFFYFFVKFFVSRSNFFHSSLPPIWSSLIFCAAK